MDSKSSDNGFIAVSKFQKMKSSKAPPETLALIQRCKHYQSHHKLIQESFAKLQKYDVVERNAKVHHDK